MHITQRTWGTGKLAGLAAGLAAASIVAFAACGGGGGDKTPTKSAAPTPAGAATAAATKGATTSAAGTTSTGGSSIPSDVGKSDKAKLTGAGATFPNPLYTRWFSDYKSSVASGVEVNYQSIGSGGGIKQITEKTVDFGASDAPMSDDELAKAAGVQHIPTTLGAVVMTYNLDGVSAPLKLDGDTIAKIYLGKITKWNDPAIAGQNAGVTLPSADIVVVHRSDGSGTSFVFTDYLSHVSADWKARPGHQQEPAVAGGPGRPGQRGRLAAGQAEQELDRLRGAGLHAAEQPAGGAGEEQVGRLRDAEHGLDVAGGVGRDDSGGLPHEHRRLADEGCVPDLELHVHPALQGRRPTPRRARRLSTCCGGRSTTARRRRRSWGTPRCRKKSSRWSRRR